MRESPHMLHTRMFMSACSKSYRPQLDLDPALGPRADATFTVPWAWTMQVRHIDLGR